MIKFDDFAGHVERALGSDAGVTIRRAPRAAHPGSPVEAADHFVRTLGFTPLGPRWIDLGNPKVSDGSPASEMLAKVLMHEPMDGHCEWVHPYIAAAYARVFSSFFDQGEVTWLTNRTGNGWSPITSSTYEWTFVVIDETGVGLFLIEAED